MEEKIKKLIEEILIEKLTKRETSIETLELLRIYLDKIEKYNSFK